MFCFNLDYSYIEYSRICAKVVRQCYKKPLAAEAEIRSATTFKLNRWTDGKPTRTHNIIAFFLYAIIILVLVVHTVTQILNFGFKFLKKLN